MIKHVDSSQRVKMYQLTSETFQSHSQYHSGVPQLLSILAQFDGSEATHCVSNWPDGAMNESKGEFV